MPIPPNISVKRAGPPFGCQLSGENVHDLRYGKNRTVNTNNYFRHRNISILAFMFSSPSTSGAISGGCYSERILGNTSTPFRAKTTRLHPMHLEIMWIANLTEDITLSRECEYRDRQQKRYRKYHPYITLFSSSQTTTSALDTTPTSAWRFNLMVPRFPPSLLRGNIRKRHS